MKPFQITRKVIIACIFISSSQACNLNSPVFESTPNNIMDVTDATIPSPSLANVTPPKITNTIKPAATKTTRPIQTDDPKEDEIWKACPDSYGSRLHVGNRAYVSFDPPLSNRVRSSPSRKANVVGMIEPGEKILIVSGPNCADDWVWWKIKSEDNGLTGWTSEGDFEDYWLVPLP